MSGLYKIYFFYFFSLTSCLGIAQIKFPWLNETVTKENSVNAISPPKSYQRDNTNENNYSNWLRQLPLKQEGSKVYLHNKSLKNRQDVHYRVININCGEKNLQQCADAVMRLRAEYLYSTKKHELISFNFTNGMPAPYSKWKSGYRIKINGNKSTWYKATTADESYASFMLYLAQVFNYAGTSSLEKELKPVKSVKDIQPGDVFITGGFPGHAVTVLDVAINPSNGKKVFLLAQSYMPAQDIHILKNFNDTNKSPWYSLEDNQELVTPEWTFSPNSLKRFN